MLKRVLQTIWQRWLPEGVGQNKVLRPELVHGNALGQLPYFVDGRPRLWVPPVRWLIGEPTRFQGKKVLELGCRSGGMSCLFGLLGAQVLGVDLKDVSLELAEREAARLGVGDRVRFLNYSGDPGTLAERDFDFVFTKSTLVMIREQEKFLVALAQKLSANGELIVAENLAGGRLLNFIRRHVIYRRRQDVAARIYGVDDAFLAMFGQRFEIVGQRRFFGLVTAIRARRSLRSDLALAAESCRQETICGGLETAGAGGASVKPRRCLLNLGV